jgi:hypothetical protein
MSHQPQVRSRAKPALVAAGREKGTARPQVAVLVPCYNEERTIEGVVRAFRRSLPDALIFVYDNNSSDRTAEVAAKAGAIVRTEPRQGKGNVVRRMFADVDADIYVLVDGDDTYDAAVAPELVERMIRQRLDFVNGARIEASAGAYRTGHRLGNRLISGVVRAIFGRDFSDMLSGYKIFSRRFVQSFPSMSRGFEIETEFTIHALELQMPCAEIYTAYRERPAGSASKLRTLPDGIRIAWLILRLVKDERPLAFFTLLGALCVVASLALGIPLVREFVDTGLVPKLPSAVLAASLMVLGALNLTAGLILDLITKTRREVKRLAYLSVRLPQWM